MDAIWFVRIIPAPAGCTASANPCGGRWPDHPRACGVHGALSGAVAASSGSSPRLRGAHCTAPGRSSGRWIIPAPAGCTDTARHRSDWWSDHPRACGVHVGGAVSSGARPGSSPRLRGARPPLDGATLEQRIIPAPAGCTPHHGTRCRPGPDHPRACGVHLPSSLTDHLTNGSSPRLRGAHTSRAPGWLAGRIIPAPAGCTRRRRAGPRPAPDHPRACGVHVAGLMGNGRRAGSSPRLRVHAVHEKKITRAGGSSPRLRGAPVQRWRRTERDTDHPRACGVHGCRVAEWRYDPGSSPRLRGALSRRRRLPMVPRIIPAPAGCTLH